MVFICLLIFHTKKPTALKQFLSSQRAIWHFKKHRAKFLEQLQTEGIFSPFPSLLVHEKHIFSARLHVCATQCCCYRDACIDAFGEDVERCCSIWVGAGGDASLSAQHRVSAQELWWESWKSPQAEDAKMALQPPSPGAGGSFADQDRWSPLHWACLNTSGLIQKQTPVIFSSSFSLLWS